jgi:hypothetical protein
MKMEDCGRGNVRDFFWDGRFALTLLDFFGGMLID